MDCSKISVDKYKNIIFDVGEVLFSYDWQGRLLIAGLPEDKVSTVGKELLNSSLWKELDRGARPYFDIVEDMCKAYPEYDDCIRRFLTNVDDIPINRPRVWEKVHQLKEKGYHLYLLSNYPEYMFKKHVLGKPFIADIDGMIVSYMVHQIKPDREIFETLLNKYNLNASECIFFDDRAENTQAAINMGIDAITVLNEDFLLDKLQEFIGK